MKKEVKILLAIAVVVVIAGVVGASFYRKSVQSVPVATAKMAEELVRADSPAMGPMDAKANLEAKMGASELRFEEIGLKARPPEEGEQLPRWVQHML